MSRRAVALVALAALVATGCRHETGPARPGDLTAFTVSELLGIGCAGIWVVDGNGRFHWLAGTEPAATWRESPAYPAFQHDGRLTFGLFRHPEIEDEAEVQVIDIVSLDDGRRLAADVLPSPFSWSPSRAQLLAIVLNHQTSNFPLVRIDADSKKTKTVVASAGFDFVWLGTGDSIAYLASENDEESLWVANPDGGEARLLARTIDGQIAASADGKRIAFRRPAKEDFLNELWVVDVESGEQQRVPGPLLPGRPFSADVWVDRETLIVHDEFPDAGSEATDAIRVDVGSGARSLLAPDAQVLEAARDGSGLLATRRVSLGSDPDHTGIGVVKMRVDGTGARLLAVTDNGVLGNVPVLQPAERELSAAEGLTPPPGLEQRCRAKLIALRDRSRKG